MNGREIHVFKEAQVTDLRQRGGSDNFSVGFGGYYIIAPENGCSGTVNVNDWQQVWQYGTDALTTDKWLQDGVAPQCGINNLHEIPEKSGRAYIPDDKDIPKGFIDSHKIKNYEWIFTRNINDKGYVKPRK